LSIIFIAILTIKNPLEPFSQLKILEADKFKEEEEQQQEQQLSDS